MKKIILIASLIFSTQVAMAKYTPAGKIVRIYTYANDAIVETTATISNQCKYEHNLLIPDIMGKGKGQLATVLFAMQGNKTVQFGYVPNKCVDVWGESSLAPTYSTLIIK